MMTDVFGPQTPEDDRQVVRSFNADGSANFGQVGVEEISYRGRFGAVVSSTTENTISIGQKYFAIDWDDGVFKTGDDILIQSMDDRDCFMWGEIVNTDTVWGPLRLTVYVDDISAVTGVYSWWELQVVARPKPGIEKDTSTSSVNPTLAGPFTFTVTAGKFFPIGGQLLIKPTTDRSIALLGRVLAYNGTSLVVSKNETNATVSQAYTSWAIALLDAPPADLPLQTASGLSMSRTDTANWKLTVAAGSIMDSTNSVLLTLDSDICKDLDATFLAGDGNGGIVRVALAGTIDVASGIGSQTVTGTSTTFLSDFDGATNNDFFDLMDGGLFPSDDANHAIISTSTETMNVDTVTNNTSMTVNNAGSIGAVITGAAYYRGGTIANGSEAPYITYFVYLIRKDTDGTIDVCCSSATPSGAPDLPSGYTHYRLIGAVQVDTAVASADAIYHFRQPIYQSTQPFAPSFAPFIMTDGSIGDLATNLAGGKLPNGYVLDDSTSITLAHGVGTLQLQRAALTGDVTASANSNATTIANDAVTNAKLANMAEATFKMRAAGAGTGDPIDGTVAQAKTALGFTSGTWTPVLTAATAGDLSITYTRQAGYYNYIDGLVFTTFRVVTSVFTHTTAAGQVSLTGLPYTSINDANYQYAGSMIWQGITKAGYSMVTPFIIHNSSQIIFPCAGSGLASANLAITDMPTGGSVILTGNIVYRTT